MTYHANPTAGVAVYNGASVLVFQNLDVSAVTGAQAVWVHLELEQTAGAVAHRCGVRTDGEVTAWWSAANTSHGGTRAAQQAGLKSIALACKTSAAGIVEWRAGSVATTVKIYVLGWTDITEDATALVAGAFPVAWTAQDVSGIVGAERAMLFLEWHRTGGVQNTMALRPGDEANNCLVSLATVSGPNQDGNDAVNIYSNPVTMTDDTGSFDYIGEAAVPNGTLDMSAWALALTPTNRPLFAAAPPPLAYTDLDCTTGPAGATGMSNSSANYVMLLVHRENIAGVTYLAFRTNGNTGDYLTTHASHPGGMQALKLNQDDTSFVVLPTDATGKVEWIANVNAADIDIELVGWIPENPAPVLDNAAPVGLLEAPDVTLSFDASDSAVGPNPGVDITTLFVRYHWLPSGNGWTWAIQNGVFESGYGGYIPPNGTQFGPIIIDTHPLLYLGPWAAEANVDDLDGVPAVQLDWAWTVTNPGPTVTGTAPTGVLVGNTASVIGTCAIPILNPFSDPVYIDQTTIALDLTDPALAVTSPIIAGVFQAGYAGTILPDGIGGVIVTLTTHPVFANGVWSAKLYCEDSLGANDSDIFGWTVVGTPPSISNEHPTGTTTEVTRIGCRCTDAQGFNTATLEMTVTPAAGVPLTAITGGVIQAGWAGTIYPYDDPGPGPRGVDIELTTWPDIGYATQVTFTVTMTNIVGLVL